MYSQIAANKRKSLFIIFIFILFVVALGWLFGNFTGNPAITPYVLAGAAVYALINYYAGSRLALAVNSAHEIQKKDNPRLYRTVENLSITEGLPMPKVYIMQDSAPNAFATGRSPANAAVCVTSGLLELMEDQELEGVLAHELGHIKNYDMRVAMVAFAMMAVVGILADMMLRMAWFGDSDNRNNQVFFVLGIVAAILAPVIALLIQMAVSRKREFLADATGALTTRYPDGLASALAKIEQAGSTLRKQNTSTAHFFFANPLKGGNLATLFSTHPPIAQRIKRLGEMGSRV